MAEEENVRGLFRQVLFGSPNGEARKEEILDISDGIVTRKLNGFTVIAFPHGYDVFIVRKGLLGFDVTELLPAREKATIEKIKSEHVPAIIEAESGKEEGLLRRLARGLSGLIERLRAERQKSQVEQIV